MHDAVNALHAVINIHETAGLMAVAPDGDLLVAGVNGFDHLPAQGRRGFFAAAVPGAVRAVDIVEPRDGRLHAAFMPVFLAEHFGHELFPAVTALRHGRIRIGFLEGAHVGILLQQGVVGAGRGGIKITAGAGAVGLLDHVRVDEDGAQALHAKPLDETHAAHVGRQVIDLVADVQAEIFHTVHRQIPFIQRLFVHRANAGEALFLEIKDQVAGNEAAGAGDHNQIIFLQDRVLFNESFGVVHRLFGFRFGCG